VTSPGLCGVCAHSRRISGKGGSRFWLCERSHSDTRYRRYPQLPVFRCQGFEPQADAADSPEPVPDHGRERPDDEER